MGLWNNGAGFEKVGATIGVIMEKDWKTENAETLAPLQTKASRDQRKKELSAKVAEAYSRGKEPNAYLKDDMKLLLLIEQKFECPLCHRDIGDFGSAALDRKIPGSKGGQYSFENCQVTCHPCNGRKGDRPAPDKERMEQYAILNKELRKIAGV